ncbi:DUF2059 domain-containing protein [Pseudoprimorskyibacter insulae]|uniref:DUF2059 domain-containing protein n=1 Tax=Pseudoprimorskyibacter insulae TaxID=1695997 RepID=A0A2R8AQ97_9RHOB|nr:DUF2059 domain-containing protein [Pseudoprimorskyibacter insulae]SPF78256.1 hypothetical protein PRI8871_00851 [Pseudoprimorskyibacter insulae]
MKRIALGLVASLALAVPAQADPKEDAGYIVSQMMTQENLSGAILSQQPLIRGALQNQYAQMGIEISDMDLFMKIFMEEFLGSFTAAVQSDMIDLHLEQFTPEELADYAAFLKTPTGQKLAQNQPVLMQRGSEIGQYHGQMTGQSIGPKLAERLKEEGVVVTRDKSMMDRLLNILSK